MSFSAQDLVVISIALICAIGNAYLFVAAVHDGHRALYRSAAVAFFGFVLVAAVFFLGRCEGNIRQQVRPEPVALLQRFAGKVRWGLGAEC